MTDARPDIGIDAAAAAHHARRVQWWDDVARKQDAWRGWGAAYHRRLEEIFQGLVAPGLRVLEVGCATGNLLAALKPAVGVGVDFSEEMIARARRRHPGLRFVVQDAHELNLPGARADREPDAPGAVQSEPNATSGCETFDGIILSDLFNDVWDVRRVLERVRLHCTPRTRVIINVYSRLWELPLEIAERLGLARPTLRQNWLTRIDIHNLLKLAGFELIRTWPEVLLPLPIPGLAPLCNRGIVRFWPFKHLALTNFFVARPAVERPPRKREPRVSVVVPARNEAGNIAGLMARLPELGGETELVFVEGGSTDDTYSAIERAIAASPQRLCQLHRQSGAGKADAVRLGFARATGEVLMILDADLTVAPEDLRGFYDALRCNRGEFINGVRLVYPRPGEAMRFANLVGNKLFSALLSFVLGQPVRDTLCGTKVLWKQDYERIEALWRELGTIDPFGDFDLILGAAKLNLRILDFPIRYRERTYGTTNIRRWRDGWQLLRFVVRAAGRIKFV
jgi:SAM-dependent methyltransferase